jgi:probable rRNA maturation factor
MLKALNYANAQLSVLLCDDLVICELNRRYRQEEGPTDVLSFSMLEGKKIQGSPDILGDIVISIPTAIRQAVSHENTLLDEINLLLAHGLLHLLGFDHQTRTQKRRMQARADVLVTAATRLS